MTVHVSSERLDARRASWGSIFGGVFTVLSVSILLSLLATALGFGVVDPLSEDPLDGVGTAFGVSSAVALLIALAAGGFVAGRLAGRSGFAHGFLVWSVSLLLATVLGSLLIGSAVRLTGNVVGSAFSLAGSAASAAGSAAASAGSAAASGIGNLVEYIGEELEIDTEIDGEQIERSIANVLRDTGADSLRPEYVERQLVAASEDVRRAVRRLGANPGDFDAIAEDLVSRLRSRADAIGADADRDAVVNALAENTDLSRSEAEELTDRLVDGIEQVRETANERLDDLQARIEEARVQLAEFEQRAREQAARATDAISRSALWAFFALLIGALVSGGAGLLGSGTRDRDEVVVEQGTHRDIRTYPPPV